jgi:amino acid adenylation domain-containing protein
VNDRVDEHFLEQVRLRPDAIAVVSGTTTMTYRQLADRATALAGGLAELGVRRETLVGMAFDRSADAVVAMLAITLAGGAYVPLNPAFPARRIADLLDDSGVRLVLGDRAGRASVAAAAPDGVRVLGLSEVPHRPNFVTPPGRSPLAYVMYTSGSTGRPKGVLVEHGGIVRLVREPDYADFSATDRFAQLSALEFDAATMEIWGALLNGARLCIVDNDTAVVPQCLAEALRTHEITVAWLTSALFNQLADEDPGMFAPLRHLLTGGDVLSPRHVELVRARNPELVLHNGYGPTENTTFTTVHRIDRRYDGPIPIGRPIRGTTVLVLDDDRKPVPAGTVGELYAGGAGVARGYLNNAELTTERFVRVDGERYYRTGDRVHADADGVLHFHGRTDGQVKIRGHRVEIGEVTAALHAVHGVIDCHVRVVDKRLVAYVVAPDTTERAVRTALADALPRYTLPDQYQWLDRLPLNANGKVDAAALPAPSRTDAAEHTAEQRALAELWSDLLGVDPGVIGPRDRFLEIGGNSIMLGVLLGRIHRRYGVQLSFTDAVAAPTLAELTKAVATAARGEVAPIPPSSGPVDLHPQQLGLYAVTQAEPDSLAYNIPVRLTVRGPLDVPRLRSACTALVHRHDALRMRCTPVAGAVRQVAVDEVAPEFEYLAAPTPDLLKGFVRPFQLDRPPLLRALLVHTGPDEHELYLDAHHIVVDGVSLRVLVRDLFALYDGTTPATQATTYADAAQWCHDRQVTEATDVTEDFWRTELAGAPMGLDLPTDRPRGRSRAVRGAVVTRTLPAARLADVDRTARQLGTTPFAVLLAAYTATLARLSGQRDLVVGTPMSGRTHPAVESVVGMFVSTVCVRAELTDDTDLAGLARQLGARQWQALSHQGFPFERLADRLGVPRDPARNPVFDALFAYQDLGLYEFTSADLAVSVELLNPGTTRFDLNLQAYRRPDRLVLDLEYARELFDPASADYLLDQCLLALDDLVEDPSTPVFAAVSTPVSVSAADFAF